MAESNFIDYVKILCRSGKGGAGSRHFHRAKYVPKGGPDGGDGGRGGHIFLRGNRNLWTLLHLRYQRHIFATNGESGGAGRSFGRDGEDRVIEVPIGTTVFDADSGEFTYFFLAPDTSAETYHIEFRYGSDADALSQYDAGDYAYWVASGISTDCDQTMIDNCIELFCTENLAG